MNGILVAVLVAATITTGLSAGLFWGWAVSVMPALRGAPDALFAEFIQRANVAIVNGWFLLCFVGALVLNVAATVLALIDGRAPVIVPVVLALVLYAATIGITGAVNIPLNNRMATSGEPGHTQDPAAIRAVFEAPWTRWNIARALTNTASLGALSWALPAV